MVPSALHRPSEVHMATPTLITTYEAAEILEYEVQHVRRLLREHRLLGEKKGRDWLVQQASVNAYIARKELLDLPFGLATPNGKAPLNVDAGPDGGGAPENGSVTVDTILSGGEPSLEQKRLAKRIAWSNGDVPAETVHRVFLGDARKMRELAAEDVHLVVTSPPYFNLIEYEGGNTTEQLGSLSSYEQFLDELDEVWKRCFDLLAPGGRMCVVVGDVCVSRRAAGRHYVIPLHADIATRCRKIGFDYLTPIYWSKIANMATEVGGSARFLGKPYEPNAIVKNDVEYILLLRKPGSYRKPTNSQRALSLLEPEEHRAWFRSVWTDVSGENRKAGHPAPFPKALAHRLIKMFSFVGDVVLDPFWGTGSTTLAAIDAVRSSVGFEIERKYIKLGHLRLAAAPNGTVPARIEFSIPDGREELHDTR
jgi:excisionase family DNA binding protein